MSEQPNQGDSGLRGTSTAQNVQAMDEAWVEIFKVKITVVISDETPTQFSIAFSKAKLSFEGIDGFETGRNVFAITKEALRRTNALDATNVEGPLSNQVQVMNEPMVFGALL